jgi:hypothetical protein
MTDAAEECKTIINIVEPAWLNGVPEGTSEEYKLIEMFHSALPKLWMISGYFEEAIIAYWGMKKKGPPTYKKTW